MGRPLIKERLLFGIGDDFSLGMTNDVDRPIGLIDDGPVASTNERRSIRLAGSPAQPGSSSRQQRRAIIGGGSTWHPKNMRAGRMSDRVFGAKSSRSRPNGQALSRSR